MKLSQPVPILRMLDQAKALEFYVGFLGFSIDWEHRFDANSPLYLQVSRGGCVLHLSEHFNDATPGGAPLYGVNDSVAHAIFMHGSSVPRPSAPGTDCYIRTTNS